MTHTCKAVAGVLPNEYCTLHRLLEYIGNDVGQALQLVRDQPDIIDERADIVHSHYKIHEVLISFDLSLDSLNRFMSNGYGSERTMVPCTAKKSPAKQNWHTDGPKVTRSGMAS
jgi:hypothetical protein